MMSYKREFRRWRLKREAQGTVFYDRLSDVTKSQEDMEVGDRVMYTNDFGVTFGPLEVLAFGKPDGRGGCVHLNESSYWYPVRPGQLELVESGNGKCEPEARQDEGLNDIMEQSWMKSDREEGQFFIVMTE